MYKPFSGQKIEILRRAGLKHLKYHQTVFVLPDKDIEEGTSTDITLISSIKVNAKINTEALQGYKLTND